MKKLYTKPEMEVTTFAVEEILTASNVNSIPVGDGSDVSQTDGEIEPW